MTATPNTSMGTVPGTTPGAGASAPAPEGLTINRDGVSSFLRRANHVGSALAHFEKIKARTHSSSDTWDHYYEAVRLLRDDWNRLVEWLRDEGGLLHLGWRA